MIVLESFWDAALLTGSGLSMDPLDPRFRELWQQAGNSHVLSPIFGGYTANAEFESLCGFPVTENHVFFESGLRNQAPCLPQILEKAGYRSIASHPNVAGFWNRVNAYRRIGFRTYWSDRDFVLDDLNGEFLSDSSLYRQTMAKIGSRADRDRPVFNFLLTYFGHVDYPLNAARPKIITTTDRNVLLNNYVNLMYYKSRELMDFLATLRRDDPDGLIVLFGDHLPFLGPGFYGYLRSQLLTDNRATMTDRMVYTLTATPLVVIDGRRGPSAPRRCADVPAAGADPPSPRPPRPGHDQAVGPARRPGDPAAARHVLGGRRWPADRLPRGAAAAGAMRGHRSLAAGPDHRWPRSVQRVAVCPDSG